MTEVRHDEHVRAERATHGVVERTELRPLRGDLDGVDERAVREHRGLPVADGVAMLQPARCRRRSLPEAPPRFDDPARLVHGVPSRAPRLLEDDDEHRAAEGARRGARVQEIVDHRRSLQEGAQRSTSPARRTLARALLGRLDAASLRHHRVEGVVETGDGRAQTGLEERAHRVPAVLRRRKRPRAEVTRGRRRMEPQLGARDHGERPLATDDERDEIRTRRAPAKVDDLAVARHALERDHHVLDLAVSPGALAGAAGGDPAADGAAEDRRREVAEREARPIQRLLERYAQEGPLPPRRAAPARRSRERAPFA